MTLPTTLVILVYGKDARTDAIIKACRGSGIKVVIYYYSEFRVAGFVETCDGGVDDGSLSGDGLEAMVAYARKVQPHLVIVGPEEPLEAGLVDTLEKELGIPCFGPRGDLARIETSKSWTRDFLASLDLGVNPTYRVIREPADVAAYLSDLSEFVVKPDGLTGGKGVKVFPEHFHTKDEAVEYAESLASDSCVVIEERLDGEEFSLMSITDGQSVLHCPVVQDHKRAYDGDEGPNTGGMGSYSYADHSLPFLTSEEIELARRTNEQVARALRSDDGTPYKGVLYGGFIATASGVRVIEYNARFGDPEALNVLPLLSGDFVELAYGVATGSLPREMAFEHRATVCKYLVPTNYPTGPKTDDEIKVPAHLHDRSDLKLYWAAVNLKEPNTRWWDEGAVVRMTGSRALAVVGIGDNLAEAEAVAESAAVDIEAASMGTVRHRRDIGSAPLLAKRMAHVERIRAPFRSQPPVAV